MPRRLVPLFAALLTAMLAFAPAARADDVPKRSNMDFGPRATQDSTVVRTDEGCGTNLVWEHTTGAGNYYAIRGWICNSDEGASGRAVAWWRIYRNGVQWENGFRGDGQLGLYRVATGCTSPCVQAVAWKFWCYTCGGAYIGYTGRQFGNLWNSPGSVMQARTTNTRFRVHFANGVDILYDNITELVANPSTI
jgi:hypothetical protein